MSKARLLPVYFESSQNQEFQKKLNLSKKYLKNEAEILSPEPLKGISSKKADAILFPRLIGDIYRNYHILKEAGIPVLVMTSDFGTMAMWDWEIVSYLQEKGVDVFAPNNLETAYKICRAFKLKREIREKSFLVYQDDPGDGMQASIFKRFFWWEDECLNKIKEKFGINIIKKSYKDLGQRSAEIEDSRVKNIVDKKNIDTKNLPEKNLSASLKLYLQLKDDIEQIDNVVAAGTNCLNESYYSDTTPCLAWNLLYENQELIWGCEADLLSMLSHFMTYEVLKSPIIMSNIYPFLMGEAALKHERIESFPKVKNPDDHVLVAHCGYLGVVPTSFATSWELKPGVLEIVEENSVAIDARLPEDYITFSKLNASLNKILAVEGKLKNYVQYPNSDCKNGAVIEVSDGKEFMEKVFSHHVCILTGKRKHDLKLLSRIFGLELIT